MALHVGSGESREFTFELIAVWMWAILLDHSQDHSGIEETENLFFFKFTLDLVVGYYIFMN